MLYRKPFAFCVLSIIAHAILPTNGHAQISKLNENAAKEYKSLNVPGLKIKEMVALLANRYKLKIEIDTKAFKAINPDAPAVGEMRLRIPVIQGPKKWLTRELLLLLLATEQQLTATLVLKGKTIQLIPLKGAKTRPWRDRTRTSPLRSKFKLTTTMLKDGLPPTASCEFVLRLLAVKHNIPIVLSARFSRKQLRQPIKFGKVAKIRVDKIIAQALKRMNARLMIRTGHIYIYPTPELVATCLGSDR